MLLYIDIYIYIQGDSEKSVFRHHCFVLKSASSRCNIMPNFEGYNGIIEKNVSSTTPPFVGILPTSSTF